VAPGTKRLAIGSGQRLPGGPQQAHPFRGVRIRV